MIDSGSDSVTLYDDIIKELQLPVIGCVTQEVPGGISRKIPLYSAFLLIGGKGIKIEVSVSKLLFAILRVASVIFRFVKGVVWLFFEVGWAGKWKRAVGWGGKENINLTFPAPSFLKSDLPVNPFG